MSFLVRTQVGVVVLLLVMELIGEVQDERDESLHVRFCPQASCSRDVANCIGDVGEGLRGEVAPMRRNPRNRNTHGQSARRCARRSATRPR